MKTSPTHIVLSVLFYLTAVALLGSLPSFVPQDGTSVAAKSKPSPSPTPSTDVTSTIFDKSVDGSTFVDLRSDDLNADLTASGGSFGIYATSAATGVIDRLETFNNSDWSLHLENSATRWLGLTLNRLSGSGPTGDYNLHGRVISRCFDSSGATTNTVSWPSITTSDPNCSMHVDFTLAAVSYSLVMNPNNADTGRATVTCNALSAGKCVDWSIATNVVQDSVVNPNPTVANLYSISPHGGKLTLIGTYSLTYRIRVTMP